MSAGNKAAAEFAERLLAAMISQGHVSEANKSGVDVGKLAVAATAILISLRR